MTERISKILNAKYIWIYGAGKVGSNAAEQFKDKNLFSKICGIVVSDLKEQPERVGNFKVREIGDVMSAPEETLFLLAVSPKYQEEMIKTLNVNGYDNYLLWDNEMLRNRWYFSDFEFIDRKRDYEKVCFILSGYKKFLWNGVFDRLQRFVPDDVEVCILSSGLYSEELDEIAKGNKWSYLYTKLNDLTLIQNIALALFDQGKWVYKVDEDIFLTEGCFEKLFNRYLTILKDEPYDVGFVAPLLPVNGYCYLPILDALGLIDEYERLFGRAKYGGHPTRAIEWNAEAAKYMWGFDGRVPQLDILNQRMETKGGYSVCGVRFSIGFILFEREMWSDMNGYNMTGGPDLGEDERNIIYWSVVKSRAMIVDHATVVGHFAFGKQTEEMKALYDSCPQLFAVQEVSV